MDDFRHILTALVSGIFGMGASPNIIHRSHRKYVTIFGMIRSVQPVQLGKWYQHEVHDNRRIKETQVVNGNVQFQVEFPFDHDVLESLENRSIIDWFQRTKGLKNDIWERWRFIQNTEACGDVQIRADHSRRGSGPSSKFLINNKNA